MDIKIIKTPHNKIPQTTIWGIFTIEATLIPTIKAMQK